MKTKKYMLVSDEAPRVKRLFSDKAEARQYLNSLAREWRAAGSSQDARNYYSIEPVEDMKERKYKSETYKGQKIIFRKLSTHEPVEAMTPSGDILGTGRTKEGAFKEAKRTLDICS